MAKTIDLDAIEAEATEVLEEGGMDVLEGGGKDPCDCGACKMARHVVALVEAMRAKG